MKKVTLTENWEQELLLQFYKAASGASLPTFVPRFMPKGMSIF